MTRTRRVAFLLIGLGLAASVAIAAGPWDVIGDGVGVITGVGDVIEWIFGAPKNDQQSVSVEWPLPSALHTELGLTLTVPFKVKFNFADTVRYPELAFVEIYVTLNNDLLYFRRYPEQGFINNPAEWFDDSEAKTLSGRVYIGADTWRQCRLTQDNLKVRAFLWRTDDGMGFYNGTQSTGTTSDSHEQYVGMWIQGRGVTEWGVYKVMTKLAQHEVTADLIVESPYRLQLVFTDHGTSKNHHNGPFSHHFKVERVYSTTQPFVQQRYPVRESVTVDGLLPHGDWTWGTSDSTQFLLTPGPAPDSRDVRYLGKHDDPHHPNDVVFYVDDWQAFVNGENHIFHGTPGQPVLYPFTTLFRPSPQALEGCPIQPFQVLCVDPHEPIPTLSVWGSVGLMIAILTGGALLARRLGTL